MYSESFHDPMIRVASSTNREAETISCRFVQQDDANKEHKIVMEYAVAWEFDVNLSPPLQPAAASCDVAVVAA